MAAMVDISVLSVCKTALLCAARLHTSFFFLNSCPRKSKLGKRSYITTAGVLSALANTTRSNARHASQSSLELHRECARSLNVKRTVAKRCSRQQQEPNPLNRSLYVEPAGPTDLLGLQTWSSFNVSSVYRVHEDCFSVAHGCHVVASKYWKFGNIANRFFFFVCSASLTFSFTVYFLVVLLSTVLFC